MNKIGKPKPEEYANFYRGYIELVGDQDVIEYLSDQSDSFSTYLEKIPKEKMSFAYHEGKWTVAQVLGHIIDTERVMAYRILRFSRQDKTPIPGFDQNTYVENSFFEARSITSLRAELMGLRAANIELIKSLTEEQTKYTGQSNEVIFSVRALVYILGGHLAHHWNILKERYEV
ncbi:DinB family protein [Marinoscillum sp. 108]|uniref:DinB family protein n=1 Tax=Marinoscillum sp. 108 TaxID=2653151 RepID=UPI0012F2B1F0|nr:DinB family protein [Marinoscillum sp. 108]VXD12496.1 DinB family protein [Marinoscillum sp. 108]